METTDTLDKIPNTKKLKGHKSAYRTRVGDYRLGFFFDNSTILLARVVHPLALHTTPGALCQLGHLLQ
jgi:mRNA-degrading endonuclease RelE of RelBE toxin-antitoxin system